MNAIHGTAPDDVWALGDGVIAHWDGKSWTEKRDERMPAFIAVQAQRRNLAWALSAKELWRWDGTAWEPYRLLAKPREGEFRALFINSRDELYIAGDRGLLMLCYTVFESWQRLETGTHKSLRALSESGRTLVIAGEDGTLLRLHRP
jgi:hypothetical protein